MTKHRIVAIKMEQHGDVFTISGLTASPRGTKMMINQVEFKPSKSSRTDRIRDIQSAVEKLLGSGE